MLARLPPITILLVLTSGTTKFPQNIGMKHPWSVEDCCLEKNMNICSPVQFRLVPVN